MEPLSRTWLAFARSCHDLGKATKELAMYLGNGTMASNTGMRQGIQVVFHSQK